MSSPCQADCRRVLTRTLHRVIGPAGDPGGVDELTVSMHTWRTELSVSARLPDSAVMRRWLCDLLRTEVSLTDRLASRFRADSEVSAVNRGAGEWVPTSWDFVAVLTASLQAAAASDGLVDPLLGAHIVAAGYDRWADQDSGIRVGPADHRWDSIEIKPGQAAAQVRIPPGTALDLGAVTKGWLADRLAQIVATSTGGDCLANMGGDLRVVSPQRPWTVAAVADDGEQIALEATDVGLATSGLGHRTWQGGHHIIDPRTGRSAHTPWSSVSVLAATAAGANTASTAALILGDAGPQWLRERGLDGWFVGQEQCLIGQWVTLADAGTLG